LIALFEEMRGPRRVFCVPGRHGGLAIIQPQVEARPIVQSVQNGIQVYRRLGVTRQQGQRKLRNGLAQIECV
jgi:hypothetical protein